MTFRVQYRSQYELNFRNFQSNNQQFQKSICEILPVNLIVINFQLPKIRIRIKVIHEAELDARR